MSVSFSAVAVGRSPLVALLAHTSLPKYVRDLLVGVDRLQEEALHLNLLLRLDELAE